MKGVVQFLAWPNSSTLPTDPHPWGTREMLQARSVRPHTAPDSAGPRFFRWLGLLTATTLLAAACPVAAAADNRKDEPPPPERITLKTTDGVTLAATYYPPQLGKMSAKDTATLILLHGHGDSRADCDELALRLQAAGNTVVVPDLRGHGDSDGADGALRAADFAAMARHDLEAVKKFLLEKNNAGQLNIERLGVVGLDMGATVALNWAALDWSWPVLATGKQGQDVKALVLISPQWSYKGMGIQDAVAHPNVRADLSVLIVAGRRNAKLLRAAKRLHNALDRHHAAGPRGADEQTLWLKTPDTSLQGAELLGEESYRVGDMILEFVEMRLVNPSFPWRARNSPLSQ